MDQLRHRKERFLLAAFFGTLISVHPHAVRPVCSLEGESVIPQGECPRRRGTTLLEVAVCVAIVGIAITALMESMASGTSANRKAMDTIVGLNLARSGREWAGTQTYATLQALCTTTKVCSPVIGGQGDPMAGYTGWSQEISAHQVSATNLKLDTTAPTDTLRVTVTAKRNNLAVCNLDWLVSNQAAATQPVGAP